jgi:hypothetical protein
MGWSENCEEKSFDVCDRALFLLNNKEEVSKKLFAVQDREEKKIGNSRVSKVTHAAKGWAQAIAS